MDLEPSPPKRPRPQQINTSDCIFCYQTITLEEFKSDATKNPTLQGLCSIFEACETRKDKLYDTLFPFKDDILSRKQKIVYHRICRATYTSKSNLKYISDDVDSESLPSSQITPLSESPARISRSDTATFSISRDCFICGKVWKKREPLSQISIGIGEDTRRKVLKAASERNNELVYLRMINHSDLFACGAKYHRGCLGEHLSQRNIDAAKRKIAQDNTVSAYDSALHHVINDIQKNIISKKYVTTLSQIKSDFSNKLLEKGSKSKVFSWKVKEKLVEHFKGKIVFIERHGKSDLVCSSKVTVGDALQKASQLQNDLEISNNEEYSDLSTHPQGCDEDYVLYSAAGILRKHMANINVSTHYYDPSSQMTMGPSADFVPNALYKFILWIISDEAHINVIKHPETLKPKSNLKAVAICHGIIANSRQIHTPITLGLGLYAHHEFRSRQLVDQLHALGHSVSYDEVRRFLTSVAKDQEEQDIYIPKGLKGPAEDGILIDAAIDNFDHNEDTIDGKTTTHAMAAVVYKRQHNQNLESSKVHRVTQKSLKNDNGDQLLKRYYKPARRPEPFLTSDTTNTSVSQTAQHFKDAGKKDLIWKLVRLRKNENQEQKCPSWTGFNSFTTKSELPIATVRYLPFIEASPTDLTTIYNILLKLASLAATLKQPHILVTADMAIYSRAQQILWTRPIELDGKITMRIGGMHLTMAFIASIGHLYMDAGLLDLLIESDVYAAGTARQILQGHQYSRGIRAIIITYEALFRTFITAMESWFSKNGRSLESEALDIKLQELSTVFEAKDQASAQDLLDELAKEDFINFQTAIEEFTKVGCGQSETFAFWSQFLDAGDILLQLLRAERDGDFSLHLSATCRIIPWLCAAGRNTYAKYVPIYVADMKALQESHPESYKHMCDGGFVVRRSSNKSFNCVATDQALEQTVNRDGKSKGGIIGLTLRKGALIRWMQTRHILSEYVHSFRSLCEVDSNPRKHHEELGKSRLAKDEAAVCQIIETISQYHNPFDLSNTPTKLINITTGQVASPEVRDSMMSFLEKGKNQHQNFVTQRLDPATKEKSFWEREHRTKTLTFASMHKSLKTTKMDKVMIDSEVLFRRLLFVSKKREINLQLVLQHELAAVPPSLFHDDGTMRKTNKSELAKKLESSCPEVYQLTSGMNSAYIIDGMAMLQGIKEGLFDTFNNLAKYVLQQTMQHFNKTFPVGLVVLVFDRYDNAYSIKQGERQRRGDTNKVSYIIKGTNAVPNYRNFMTNSANKAALACFISEYFVAYGPTVLQSDQSIILAGGFREGHLVKQIAMNSVSELPELFSSQEEADTRMVLHAIHLSSAFERIIVKSDDTDVLVLLMYYVSMNILGSLIYMQAGHTTQVTNRQRYIPVNSIVDKVGHDLCKNLPAAHALTGCDTTSSLFRIGKRTAYSKLVELVKKNPSIFNNFGLSDSVEDDYYSAQTYVLSFYAIKGTKCKSLNQLRYMFASLTDRSAADFPPTEDAFKQHVMRARHQVAIWCTSHIANPMTKDPTDNGWKTTEDDILEPVMFTKDAAPVQVRDLTHLYCSDCECTSNGKCQCILSGLQCTEFCACQASCCNTNTTTDSDNDDTDE